MNLLHFSAKDISGGAAQATYRIHSLLREAGYRSVLAVRRKDSSDPDVVRLGVQSIWTCSWSERIERGRARLAGHDRAKPILSHAYNRNIAPVPDLRAALDVMPHPDVIFLHWITCLLTAADIRRIWERLQCPMVWVFMDVEPMTGGCHYPRDCTRFHVECGHCPQLRRSGPRDWAWRTWREKHRQIADLPITCIAGTQWIADRLSKSGLFGRHRVVRIPLPMSAHMRPMGKNIARNILDLPIDKKLVLVGSENLKDSRKGMDRLVAAARMLAERDKSEGDRLFRKDDVLFLLIGSSGRAVATELPFPSRDMGYVRSEVELALAYQAADVFVCPSLEDAGPVMVSQAMMCGTPVVAFNTGIAPELIRNGENGYLARCDDVAELAEGMQQLLQSGARLGRQAATVALQHHAPEKIMSAYQELLTGLVNRREGKKYHE